MKSNICSVCHRPLKSLESISRGMGPVCSKKNATDLQETKYTTEDTTFIPWQYGEPFSFQRDENGHKTMNVPWRRKYHSPTGLEWGYSGSGPADTALNILLCYTDADTAMKLHQAFKFNFVAGVPRDGGTIEHNSIIRWLEHETNGLFKKGS